MSGRRSVYANPLIPEQPTLLQRWLPHFSPPQSSPTLERSSPSLLEGKGAIRCTGSTSEIPVCAVCTEQADTCDHGQVLHNIDYLMITVRLLMKDYATLARCMVPINGEQMAMTMADREAFLKEHTRPFTEKEIAQKFRPAITALSTSVDATPPVQQNEVRQ